MPSSDWDRTAVVGYWDAVAARYLELFRDEFSAKPFDRAVIRVFAADLGAGAAILDAGCGPCGQVARLLSDYGATVTGVDISSACIALARQEEPALRFEVMDMADTAFEDGSFDGVVAYYALHYQPKQSLAGVVREFARVLRGGGRLLLVAKEGSGEGWIADPLGITGTVFWSAMSQDELMQLVADNGFDVVGCEAREALAQEIDVRRLYLTARRKESLVR